jgi:ABC-type uncharacterized transport system involved in gliding motility auxiliary subunit
LDIQRMRCIRQTTWEANRRVVAFGKHESAKAQTILLGFIVFILGVGLGAFWLYLSAQARERARQQQQAVIHLSEGTMRVLRSLQLPVELRFYDILAKESASDSLRAFAGRVDQLLSEYERAANGKLTVVRHNTQSDADAAAAEADGIRAFNLDKGEGCFLGIAIAQQDQKEALAQLAPEWETALESDLTRAILRVTEAQSAAARVAVTAKASAAATEEVKKSIPDPASVPVEEGRRILREAAMKELKAALSEMEVQLQAAKTRLNAAQQGNSEDEQQAAMKEFQRIQTLQAQKVKEITARFQAQTTAWEKLKGTP